jgi:hypothetical protein
MTDQEVLKFYKELEEHYGDKLANVEHHPRQFQWQVITYRYYVERK